MAILEGTSPKDKLESTYRRVLTKNYMVWPIAQAVNFTFVPLDSRVLYVSAVSIGMFLPLPCGMGYWNRVNLGGWWAYRLELLLELCQQPENCSKSMRSPRNLPTPVSPPNPPRPFLPGCTYD